MSNAARPSPEVVHLGRGAHTPGVVIDPEPVDRIGELRLQGVGCFLLMLMLLLLRLPGLPPLLLLLLQLLELVVAELMLAPALRSGKVEFQPSNGRSHSSRF